MGSGSSKNSSLAGSNLNSGEQRERSRKEKGKIGKVFISSCFGLPPTLPQQVPPFLFSNFLFSLLGFNLCLKQGSLASSEKCWMDFIHIYTQ